MLKSLKLHGVGPVKNLSAIFGDRINLFTGDNGLGKSFLLDVCFWSLTGNWPGNRIAIPDQVFKVPSIEYKIKSKNDNFNKKSIYRFRSQSWDNLRGRPYHSPGIVIYAAVDGSFSVWDPARNFLRDYYIKTRPFNSMDYIWPKAFQFPPESWSDYDDVGTAAPIRKDVANGLEEMGRVLCNGLIDDWGEWYYQRSDKKRIDAFKYLEDVVSELSHPTEPIQCIEPHKVYLDDSRKFPTLQMPYGKVSYPHWSAGVKRIINLAYLIVWSWVEHLEAVNLQKEEPSGNIVIIVDEVESHLHPKWQRTILPAMLRVVNRLREDISVQILAATHSPLVLASLEPEFNEEKDKFFCFELKNEQVIFESTPWTKQGDVVAWLTSDVFGLAQARSKEAELVIEAAEAYMRGEKVNLVNGLKSKDEITEELKKLLPGLDPFWPRWILESQDD